MAKDRRVQLGRMGRLDLLDFMDLLVLLAMWVRLVLRELPVRQGQRVSVRQAQPEPAQPVRLVMLALLVLQVRPGLLVLA